MFLELDKKNKEKTALIDSEGTHVSYGDIVTFSYSLKEFMVERTLVFILNNNSVGAAIGYLGVMINCLVPLIIPASMDSELLNGLIETYHPKYLWKPKEMIKGDEKVVFEAFEYSMILTGYESPILYDDLSLLLTTSGSTGSPKLVRHSYKNLEEQAKNIAAFFEMNGTERAMVDLPINYTMGLSVLNSHLYAGALVLLTSLNPFKKEYWSFLKENETTVLTNVPYYYQILKKLRFFNMDIPSVKIITQGGGRMNDELYTEYAKYAQNTGRKFIPTYGQTEGSARMAYLPSEYACEKCGSIGNAIPNGLLYIIDGNGNKITEPDVIGEMVYEGPNVTLGYAEKPEDLKLGDERHGILYTGDMAKMDKDGFFYIVGRKSRFLKLWGYRVSLDECENLIRQKFGIDCACTGSDESMKIYIDSDFEPKEIQQYISIKTHIHPTAFVVFIIDKIPRNEAGKIMYSKL